MSVASAGRSPVSPLDQLPSPRLAFLGFLPQGLHFLEARRFGGAARGGEGRLDTAKPALEFAVGVA